MSGDCLWCIRGLLHLFSKPHGHPQPLQALQPDSATLPLLPMASEHLAGLMDRACAKLKAKDYEGAIPDFDEVLKLDDKNARAWAKRGGAKFGVRDYEAAIQDLDEALQLDPENPRLWRKRGLAKVLTDDSEGGLEDLDAALKFDPKLVRAWESRAMAKVLLGDCLGGMQDLDEALKLDPMNASAWTCRGAGNMKVENYRAAIQDFNEALRLHPGTRLAWSHRGAAKLKTGENYESAMQDLTEARRRPCDYGNFALLESLSRYVDEHVLLDEVFAGEAKEEVYLLKITTAISGRSCIVVGPSSTEAADMYGDSSWMQEAGYLVLEEALERLDLFDHVLRNHETCDPRLQFIEDSEVRRVPMHGSIGEWPGNPQPGQVMEYKLVL